MKIAFLALIFAVVVAAVAVLGVIGVVFIGYGVGLVITLIPFLPGFLVGGPVTIATIPVITAWIAIASAMFSAIRIKINVKASKPAMVPVKEIEFKTKESK